MQAYFTNKPFLPQCSTCLTYSQKVAGSIPAVDFYLFIWVLQDDVSTLKFNGPNTKISTAFVT